jgi:hypothetical protein
MQTIAGQVTEPGRLFAEGKKLRKNSLEPPISGGHKFRRCGKTPELHLGLEGVRLKEIARKIRLWVAQRFSAAPSSMFRWRACLEAVPFRNRSVSRDFPQPLEHRRITRDQVFWSVFVLSLPEPH